MAQGNQVTTFAGLMGYAGNVNAAGRLARLSSPTLLLADPNGYLLVYDSGNSAIRKIAAAGTVTTFVTGISVGGWSFAANGDLLVADSARHVISRITPLGGATIIAGIAGQSGPDDGTAFAAKFSAPRGVVENALGNIIIADTGNHTLRQLDTLGQVTTIGGTVGTSGTADGVLSQGVAALFNGPAQLIRNGGSIFLVDSGAGSIRQILNNSVTTVQTGLASPAIALGSANSIFIAEANRHLIQQLNLGGIPVPFAGIAATSGFFDGPDLNGARFNRPSGILVDAAGRVIVADQNSHAIRRIAPSAGAGPVFTTPLANIIAEVGSAVTLAAPATGNGLLTYQWFRNGQLLQGSITTSLFITSDLRVTDQAQYSVIVTDQDGVNSSGPINLTVTITDPLFNFTTVAGNLNGNPTHFTLDTNGNFYIAETTRQTVSKLSPSGALLFQVGLPNAVGSADGTGAAARFKNPVGICRDSQGNLYVADNGNSTIRKITPLGQVITIAGTANQPGFVDGLGSAARFTDPRGIAIDAAGNLFVADNGNSAIRKIVPQGAVGTVSTIATGVNSGQRGEFSHLAVSPDGTFTVPQHGQDPPITASQGNIKAVTLVGGVSVVAGSPSNRGLGYLDATGTSALFSYPIGVALDTNGDGYVTDGEGPPGSSHTIRRIRANTRIVTTVAGINGVRGAQNGLGTAATFDQPRDLKLDSAGNMYVLDASGTTIRKGVRTIRIAIDQQPQSRSVAAGTNVTFNVVASGLSTPIYQWRFNGTDLPGQTGSSLSLTNVQVANSGNYDVVVQNSFGTIVSQPAALLVNLPPFIILPPLAAAGLPGQAASFSVLAGGTDPLTYQWKKDGAIINGANQPFLILPNPTLGDQGLYSVTVQNTFGTVNSPSAPLIILQTPIITLQPVSQFVTAGSSASFRVGLVEPTAATYQWRFNGTPVIGAAADTLLVSDITQQQAGTYDAVVSNAAGSSTSTVAFLSVLISPIILTNPVPNLAVSAGAVLNLSVSAIAVAPFSSPAISNLITLNYFWRRNGLNLPVPSLPTLTISNVRSSDAGTYDAVVYNSAGVVLSTTANVTVNSPPVITAQPLPQGVLLGGTATFSVTATGTGARTYQWRLNGVSIANATNASYSLASVQPADVGVYSVVVTDVFGPSVSADAPLTVLGTPVITTQPQGAFGVAGTNLSLSVVAAGSPPPAFQWFRNGVPVAGATSPVLSFTNVQTTNSGLYTVTVTNLAGVVTSAPATLTVALGAFAPVTRPEPGMIRTNGFTLDLALAPGRIYRVQASTNLVNWSDIAYLIGGTNAQQFVDRQATNSSRRFYRIVTP